jgi:hypothetical protein
MVDGIEEQGLSKRDVATRQLETAINLWFEDRDCVSTYTLAYASLSVLMNISPPDKGDGFLDQLKLPIKSREGESLSVADTANFFKHADRDRLKVMENFQPGVAWPVIHLAILAYQRLTGDLTPKMFAFNCWRELTVVGHFDIEGADVDMNAFREALKSPQRGGLYRWLLENYDQFEKDARDSIMDATDHNG